MIDRRESFFLAAGIAPLDDVKPTDFAHRMIARATLANVCQISVAIAHGPSSDFLPLVPSDFVFSDKK
jgi:hypothetical protein